MRYNFKDILNKEIYDNSMVLYIFGKYNIFNNLICDEIKEQCLEGADTSGEEVSAQIASEFGIEVSREQESSNSVDFNTFMNVVDVPSINGKWYCRVDIANLNTKQLELLNKYIRNPSKNGILLITSTEWINYRKHLNNRVAGASKVVNLIQLSFPNRAILKSLVRKMFAERGLEVTEEAINWFIMKMNNAYDDYYEVMDKIKEATSVKTITLEYMKEYTKGIENFTVDNLMDALINKKAKTRLKMLAVLEEEEGGERIIKQLLKIIEESIDLRILINKGIIPIGVSYFFKDIVKGLERYEGMNEWVFKKKVDRASQTSLKDWEYMFIILNKAISNKRVSEEIYKEHCHRALYQICVRDNLSEDRLNNILNIKDTTKQDLLILDNISLGGEKNGKE